MIQGSVQSMAAEKPRTEYHAPLSCSKNKKHLKNVTSIKNAETLKVYSFFDLATSRLGKLSSIEALCFSEEKLATTRRSVFPACEPKV